MYGVRSEWNSVLKVLNATLRGRFSSGEHIYLARKRGCPSTRGILYPRVCGEPPLSTYATKSLARLTPAYAGLGSYIFYSLADLSERCKGLVGKVSSHRSMLSVHAESKASLDERPHSTAAATYSLRPLPIRCRLLSRHFLCAQSVLGSRLKQPQIPPPNLIDAHPAAGTIEVIHSTAASISWIP